MKLIECHVENFGNLHDYNYKFEDGVNKIREDNGYGKTTFASFIKAMFYGLDAGTSAKSDRKKYMPWQGGNYGGYIEFKIKRKKYRLERFFGKKQSEDTFKIYDLSTNLESNTYTSNIGEEIFSLNKSAYERSTYIPQGQIQIEMEDSISAKLLNMLESDNDINTSDEALKRIGNAKKVYIKDRGKTGLIDENIKKLNNMERELEKTKSDEELLQNSKEKLLQIMNIIEEKEKTKNKMESELTKKMEQGKNDAILETYNIISSKYQKAIEQMEPLKEFFKNGIPEDEDLKRLIENNTEFENAKNEAANSKLSQEEFENLNRLQEKFSERKFNEEEIDSAIKDTYELSKIEKDIQFLNTQKESEEKSSRLTKKVGILIGVIGFIAIVAGIVLKFMLIQETVGIISLAIGIIVVLISILVILKGNKSKIKEVIKRIEEKEKIEKQIKDELNDIINKSISNSSEIAIELSNLKTSYREFNELKNKKTEKDFNLQRFAAKRTTIEDTIKTELLKYFTVLDKPYLDLIQEISINKNQLKMNQEQLESLKKEKEEFEKENKIEELKKEQASKISEEEIKQNISKLKEEINQLSDAKNQLKNNIDVLENKIDDMLDLENDISNLQEDIEKYKQKYDILDKTEELLKIAKEQFSSNYMRDMVEGFKKHLDTIDNKKLITTVDPKLNVKIEVNGSKKDVNSFSAGYKDLIYICMRFGLINALYKDEKPFVILDDPFVNLDDDKTEKALDILKEIGKEFQIIYFVCNSSRI